MLPHCGRMSLLLRYMWKGHQSCVGAKGPKGDTAPGLPVFGPLWQFSSSIGVRGPPGAFESVQLKRSYQSWMFSCFPQPSSFRLSKPHATTAFTSPRKHLRSVQWSEHAQLLP
jgi:hypothetical protein